MVEKVNSDTIPFPIDGFIVAAEIITPAMITGAKEDDDVSSIQWFFGVIHSRSEVIMQYSY